MKSNCKILVFVFLWSFASAANKVGNGGNGVFCKATDKNQGKLLDFYENKVNFETDETNPEVIAEKQLSKLKIIAPRLSGQYIKRLKEMSKEIDYKSDVALTDTKDSKHLFQPLSSDCQVLQVAIRKTKPLPNEKRFLIREDLWGQLSPGHRAGLLTHEIVYEHLAKLGENDSVKARKLNSYLYENEVKREEFWKFIKELEVPIYP